MSLSKRVAKLARGSNHRRYDAHDQRLTPDEYRRIAGLYGERRRPDPQGQPGYLRVDTVHQGDRDGQQGLYHLNTVDAVTQWEIVGCVPQISECSLVPVLHDLLEQYPLFEKLKSFPKAQRFLRPGVTLADLEGIAQAHSASLHASQATHL